MGKINKGIMTEIQPKRISQKNEGRFEQSSLSDVKYLSDNIKAINNENCQLKLKLLGLIDDYKLLKQYVLNNNDYNHKKRSFNELEQSLDVDFDLTDDTELKNLDESFKDIKLNTSSKTVLTDFLEEDELIDEELDDFIDDLDSPLLSRTSSPSEDENNSLMTTLTRSTTVSTNNSFMDKMEIHSSQSRFFDLPKFVDNNNANHNNQFKNLSKNFDVLQQDQYNLINDFLEEKLIDNDVNYYQTLNFQND